MPIEQRQVVGAILICHDGRHVLLQQRDDKPNLRYAGYWTLFGGAVEPGESPDEAVRRELQEELAMDDILLRHWLTYECTVRSIPGQRVTTNSVYVGRLNRPAADYPLYEGQAKHCFTPDEARVLTLAFDQDWVLARFFDDGMMEATL